MLIGRIYPGIIEVTQFTAPQPTDTRRYASYTRRRAGHVDIATRIWEQSGGLEGYVGEWHTHPESIPKPSQRDLTETKKIARANGDTVVALILGQDHGCIFFADPQKVSAPIIFPLAEFSGHENA